MSILHESSLPKNHSLAGISGVQLFDRSWACLSHCRHPGVGRDWAWLKTTCRDWVLSPSSSPWGPGCVGIASHGCTGEEELRKGLGESKYFVDEGVTSSIVVVSYVWYCLKLHLSILPHHGLLMWSKKQNVLGIEEWEVLIFLRLAHLGVKTTRGHKASYILTRDKKKKLWYSWWLFLCDSLLTVRC